MTVAAANVETAYALTASNLGPFSTVWPYEAQSDVVVWLDTGSGPVALASGSAYSQTDSGAGCLVGGGTVTLSSSLLTSGVWTAGAVLYLTRGVAGGQPSAFGETGSFSPAANESAIDHLARQIQELKAAVGRSLRLRPGESGGALPSAAQRAGQLLGFDSSGAPTTMASLNTASVPVGAYAISVVAQATQQAMLATLGVSRVVGLEYFANQIGATLGGANDQAIWTAAQAAMAAASGLGGLFVKVPPGVYSLNNITLYNRGGFFCDPGTVLLNQIVANPATPTPFVSLSNAYDTGYVFCGFLLFGGWTYGRAPYAAFPETDPWLFQYPGSIPDAAHPDASAQFGQTAIKLLGADSGVSDATYIANSAVGSQVPRGLIANLGIYNFGGDGLWYGGAGATMIHNVAGENLGGRGLVLSGYDMTVTQIDFGALGLEGLVLHPNGSSSRLSPVKFWYAGQRSITGHMAGWWLNQCTGTQVYGQSQDQAGELVKMDGCYGCTVDVRAGWEDGVSNLMYDATALALNGAATANQVRMSAVRTNAANALRLIRTSRISGNGPVNNQITITHTGFPNDFGVVNPFWLVDPNSDLDNNIVTIGRSQRNFQEWTPDSTGRCFFGPKMGGAAVGYSVGGPLATYPGQISVISQGAQGGTISHYTNSAAAAAQTLTSTQNYADGEVIATVGGKVYHARATLNGLTSVDGDVHLGATEALTLANFCNAVTCNGGTRGTDYAWQTTPHPSVTATNNGAHIITLTALLGGTAGNAITTTTGAAHATMGGATLAGGTAGAQTYAIAFSWNSTGASVGPAAIVALPIASANQAAVSLSTTQTAGSTYTSNEQTMLANIKTDLGKLQTLANQIRADLVAFGIEKGSA